MSRVENPGQEDVTVFEQRKKDHIQWALDQRTQSLSGLTFESVELDHEALPDLNFDQVSLSSEVLGENLPTPLLISSMTAGHGGAGRLNLTLSKVAARRGWLMGVGSQRRQLFDGSASEEWRGIRRELPKVKLLGNLGITQAIETPTDKIRELADSLEAWAMIIHTNPLQEVLQVEGTPQFKGSISTLERLIKELNLPVIIKETGCGFSSETLKRLEGMGVAAVDISGRGGTHWGRLEGLRAGIGTLQDRAAQTFGNWGRETVDILASIGELDLDYEVWASGGVRSGLDAAKALAMGAKAVGFAQPLLVAALKGEEELERAMEQVEFELKCALFCTGVDQVSALQKERKWHWRRA